MKNFKRFLSILCALALCLSCGVTAFASEVSDTPVSVSVASTDEGGEPVPYGSLSGYASFNFTYGKTERHGSFPIQVNGSWSPWAGWTVKTNFDPSETGTIFFWLTRPDGSKIGDFAYPGANGEVKNMALFNVPAGTYQVNYKIDSFADGNVQVWIY